MAFIEIGFLADLLSHIDGREAYGDDDEYENRAEHPKLT
jgi:hypothetical protein